MAGWCVNCRSEWWIDEASCPDCGVPLVDGPLPDLEPDPVSPAARSWSAGAPVHDSTDIDVSEVDDAARWRLGLELDSLEIPHQATGIRLTVPADAVEVVEALLSEIAGGSDSSAPGGHAAGEDMSAVVAGNRFAQRDDLRRPGGRRAAAWFVDLVSGYLVAGAATTFLSPAGTRLEMLRFTFWVLLAAWIAIPTLVWSRSAGKAALGLRIERLDGNATSVRDRAIRCIVALTPIWIPMLPWPRGWNAVTGWSFYVAALAVALSTLFGDEFRGIADKAAGTVVRRTPDRS